VKLLSPTLEVAFGAQDFVFRLKPVVEFGAVLAAALQVDLMCPLPDPLFKR
jgi:hypothetical protein